MFNAKPPDRPALEQGKRSDMPVRTSTAMLASLKDFISTLAGESKRSNRYEEDGCRVAIAALLIRAASMEADMSLARRAKLHGVLKAYFGCDDEVTIELIADGGKAAREAVDLYHFTKPINFLLSDEGHRRIIQMMWEVLYADGSVSPLESNIVWRTADLLGVSSRQRIELRQRIASERAALVCSTTP
jgi:uncharacterized tellurite resistance protein B-like protein